jgi:hypothetical protein
MAAKTAGTWAVTSPVGFGQLDQVDTTARFPLGSRCKAKDVGSTAYGDGEFIYLSGVGSTVRGSVVLITDDYGTALIQARDKGGVGVALAVVDATTKYGWYQVLGKGVAACDTVADGAPCYIDGTAGRIDDAAVAGDAVLGMRTSSADDTNTCLVTMASYPSVGDFDNA